MKKYKERQNNTALKLKSK